MCIRDSAKVVDGKVTSKENGETITLGAKVEAMKKDAATDFMFGDAPKYSGWKPGENGMCIRDSPWTTDNQTFRDRCWTNKQSLVNSVNTQLTQMVIRGEAPDRAISAISKQFDVSRAKAGRLVMTESAYFSSAVQKDCYKALDVERYEVVASRDHKVCSFCADMDSKVFKMSDYQVGLTAPPFHPWCRCCTTPYADRCV